MSISSFFGGVLHAPLRNIRWPWGVHNPDTGVVVLRLWRDRIRPERGDIEVFYEGRPQDAGQKERTQHLNLIESGARAFGVICDRDALPVGMASSTISEFDRNTLLVLGKIAKERSGAWHAKMLGSVSVSDYLASLPSVETEQEDIAQIQHEVGLTDTDRVTLAKARLGQGTYKAKMLAPWDHRCAVSGCAVPEVLRESHAKPWRQSDNSERRNPHNGLPLVATLDTLFDAGLIAFDQTGQMLVSKHIDARHRELLGLPTSLRKQPTAAQRGFLQWHHEHVFRRRDHMPS
jgi:hypothetical protein